MINQELKEHWHKFYSNAWEMRMKVARNIINSGETNPYRVLKIFNYRGGEDPGNPASLALWKSKN